MLVHKFFADRGTHLAAMVAYFALLSFVPLIFLALSLFGLAHRAEASTFLIKELKHVFPGTSVEEIVRLVQRVQNNAAALGIIGGIGLLWSSLSFFSALESAFNIVYGLPNRRFLHGKGIAASLMASVLTTLFVSLVVGAFGATVLKHPPPVRGQRGHRLHRLDRRLAHGRLRLPPGRLHLAAEHGGDLAEGATRRDRGLRLPRGSLLALPFFVRHASVNLTLRTLGAGDPHRLALRDGERDRLRRRRSTAAVGWRERQEGGGEAT